MRKLKKQSGEMLVETLVALLILTMMMVALPVCITTAAKLNSRAENIVTFCNRSKETPSEDMTLTVDGVECDVNGYESEGFYYYESK